MFTNYNYSLFKTAHSEPITLAVFSTSVQPAALPFNCTFRFNLLFVNKDLIILCCFLHRAL